MSADKDKAKPDLILGPIIRPRSTDSSITQYTNNEYTVFHLTDFDKYCDCKFILSNKFLATDENDFEELLVPGFREPITENFSYMEKFLSVDADSVFGRQLINIL